MSHIDTVRSKVKVNPKFFEHLSGECYVRILDTPHVWNKPFNEKIIPIAEARAKEFERAVVEIIEKSRYRCDLASLNSPDPPWAKVIVKAMDRALTEKIGRTKPTQFRFLFGLTPMILTEAGKLPQDLQDFKSALVELVRDKRRNWEVPPEIWMGRFYRIQEGIVAGLVSHLKSGLSSWMTGYNDADDFTKMTWNHSKIIAVDGAEALVGGHNLNMDLFTSYPPVHDVSVVVHGKAAHGSQLFLNRMWECKTELLTKEYLDVDSCEWKNGDDDNAAIRRPTDPLSEQGLDGYIYMRSCHGVLEELHGRGHGGKLIGARGIVRETKEVRPVDEAARMRAEDIQTLIDLEEPLIQERKYANLGEFEKATSVLSVGKYWSGPDLKRDYQQASEVMKEQLIKGAKRILRLSQMDLVSAWKRKWESHVVCRWIMEALLANEKLVVQVVVSPLDAGAGAGGDQYSFGSGASRTFDLFRYYMLHDVRTDEELPDGSKRERALDRLHIAPLYFTLVPDEQTIEGETYHWPGLDSRRYTATLKEPPLVKKLPEKGIIGDPLEAIKKASGKVYKKVPSAPGNHAKIMIVDDESYVVGSDNLYPGSLSEFNYLVEGEAAVGQLLRSYWDHLWRWSSLHCVNPACKAGCKAGGPRTMTRSLSSSDLRAGISVEKRLPSSQASGKPGLGRSRSTGSLFGKGSKEEPAQRKGQEQRPQLRLRGNEKVIATAPTGDCFFSSVAFWVKENGDARQRLAGSHTPYAARPQLNEAPSAAYRNMRVVRKELADELSRLIWNVHDASLIGAVEPVSRGESWDKYQRIYQLMKLNDEHGHYGATLHDYVQRMATDADVWGDCDLLCEGVQRKYNKRLLVKLESNQNMLFDATTYRVVNDGGLDNVRQHSFVDEVPGNTITMVNRGSHFDIWWRPAPMSWPLR
jgi:phosphatidylserine/phosphatidylglycerophosphate/cardiolipin synthase-like enzyme